MSMSGIPLDSQVKPTFEDVKLKHTHKFVCFKFNDKREKVIVDEEITNKGKKANLQKKKEDEAKDDEEDFNRFKELVLGCGEPRFLVYDFKFYTVDGRFIEKVALIGWCNDNMPIKLKMVYGSTKDSVKKALDGIAKDFQCNDAEDLDYQTLIKEFKK